MKNKKKEMALAQSQVGWIFPFTAAITTKYATFGYTMSIYGRTHSTVYSFEQVLALNIKYNVASATVQ